MGMLFQWVPLSVMALKFWSQWEAGNDQGLLAPFLDDFRCNSEEKHRKTCLFGGYDMNSSGSPCCMFLAACWVFLSELVSEKWKWVVFFPADVP